MTGFKERKWRPAVQPHAEMTWRHWLVYALIVGPVLAGVAFTLWNGHYWGNPPNRIPVVFATQRGVIHYDGRRGYYGYTLRIADGEGVALSCEPVYRRFPDEDCMTVLTARGIARWSGDGERSASPVVEVGYVTADDEPRFNNLVYSVRLDGVEQLNPSQRLDDAGIDPSGRYYVAWNERRRR
jgi:hypothetical protein